MPRPVLGIELSDMKFYIVFMPSGDTLPLISDKPDLLDYYISFLQQNNANQFNLISGQKSSRLSELRQTLDRFNQTVVAQLISFDCPDNELDLLDQNLLNKIHNEWVHSNHTAFQMSDLKEKYPALTLLFDQISDDIPTVIFKQICYKYDLQTLHSAINFALHKVESLFDSIKFQARFDRDWGWIETKNPFSKKYTSNSVASFSLSFNHYGRTLHNKFCTFDLDLEHDDENTFNQLLGFVQLSLLPPETIEYSPQYLEWCYKINREPGGNTITLGNIVDLEKHLLDYRKLLYKNVFSDHNFFTLSFQP